MSSEVEIVNSALIKIGEETINALTENKRSARLANRLYATKRDALQRMYRWNFTIARATLAPESTTPDFGFENKFMLPADNIAFLGIYDADELQSNYTSAVARYKIEGNFILADGDTLEIFYRQRVTDTTKFDALFVEALAWFLAADLAYALSTGPERARDASRQFQEAIRQAKLADAIETQPEVMVANDWIDSRSVTGRGPFREGPILE